MGNWIEWEDPQPSLRVRLYKAPIDPENNCGPTCATMYLRATPDDLAAAGYSESGKVEAFSLNVRQREGLSWLFRSVSGWSSARWDQHLRDKIGDDEADVVIATIGAMLGGWADAHVTEKIRRISPVACQRCCVRDRSYVSALRAICSPLGIEYDGASYPVVAIEEAIESIKHERDSARKALEAHRVFVAASDEYERVLGPSAIGDSATARKAMLAARAALPPGEGAGDPDAPIKCTTFGGDIPPDVRARMDADRAAATPAKTCDEFCGIYDAGRCHVLTTEGCYDLCDLRPSAKSTPADGVGEDPGQVLCEALRDNGGGLSPSPFVERPAMSVRDSMLQVLPMKRMVDAAYRWRNGWDRENFLNVVKASLNELDALHYMPRNTIDYPAAEPHPLPASVERVVEAAMSAWKAHQDHSADEPECRDARIALWKTLQALSQPGEQRSVRVSK